MFYYEDDVKKQLLLLHFFLNTEMLFLDLGVVPVGKSASAKIDHLHLVSQGHIVKGNTHHVPIVGNTH